MNEILTWGTVLFAARGLALLLLCAAAVVLLAGFGRLMAGRLPFRKLSAWGGASSLIRRRIASSKSWSSGSKT